MQQENEEHSLPSRPVRSRRAEAPPTPDELPAIQVEAAHAEPLAQEGSTREPPPPHTVGQAAAADEEEPERPPLSSGGDLGRARTPVRHTLALFLIVASVYLSLIGRFLLYSSPPTGDQPTYMMVAASIAQDFDLNLKNNFDQQDEDKFYGLAPHPPDFVGMSAPYPLPRPGDIAVARPETELYDPHTPGLPILITPAWIVGSWFNLWWPMCVAFMCILGALVATNIFLFSHEVTGKLWIAWVVALTLAFSNPIMSYSYLIFTELPSSLLLVYAFRRLALGWDANGPWRKVLIGACIAYLPWVSWRYITVAAPLGLYALIQWLRLYRPFNLPRLPFMARREPQKADRSDPDSGDDLSTVTPREAAGRIRNPLLVRDRLVRGARSAVALLVPIFVAAPLLLWHNFFMYGAPAQPAAVPELGFNVSPFTWPWQGIDGLTKNFFAFFGQLFDRPMGLLSNTPVYVLSVVGMIVLFRSRQRADRRLLLGIFLVAAPFMALITAFYYWNGIWNPPARYFTTIAPLMAAPLSISLLAAGGGLGWLYRGLFALLAIPGLILMAMRMYDARYLWPTNTISGWLYESPASPFRADISVALAYERLFPAFSPVEELRLPANTGWMLGASILLTAFSYLLITRPRAPLRLARILPRPAHALIWAASLGIFLGGWFLINREYLKHRTVLAEIKRWAVSPLPVQPEGIALYNGNIFVSDFRGPGINRLDTNEERTYSLTLQSDGTAQFANPGDITISADGTLFVLNNHAGENGLLAIDPDGKVLGRYPLAGKSTTAVGISMAPDGWLYVSDMVGSQVLRYPQTGGDPTVALRDPPGGYNNIKGVIVGPDGTIYVADLGNQKVHRWNSDHTYNRGYPVGCQPHYLALNGKWIDLSCGDKLLSLDLETGNVQYVIVENGPQPFRPNGLEYAPDGTLYVYDNHTVVAYKVTH